MEDSYIRLGYKLINHWTTIYWAAINCTSFIPIISLVTIEGLGNKYEM